MGGGEVSIGGEERSDHASNYSLSIQVYVSLCRGIFEDVAAPVMWRI